MSEDDYILVATYEELIKEHDELTAEYAKLLAENNRLTEELQKEKAAYISLKGRLHASNYTMSNEEFQAIMLDTKHKIMMSHNTELPT